MVLLLSNFSFAINNKILLSELAFLEITTSILILASDVSDSDARKVGQIDRAQHIHGLLIDLNSFSVDSRLVRDEIHAAFTFFLLNLREMPRTGPR